MNSKMLKKAMALTLSLSLLTGVGLTNVNFAATKSYKVGDIMTDSAFKGVKYPTITNIVNKDLSGDGKADLLYVVGSKFDKADNYFEQFYYLYKDGKTGKQALTKLPFIEGYSAWGYEPAVELVKLDSDNISEVQFSSYSGGSGGFVYYNVASFKNGVFKSLLDQKALSGITVTGKYVDGFKADMYCKEIDKHWFQDLSYEKDMLIESKIYDKTGKLLTPTEAWTGPLVNLKIQDGFITAVQSIKGIANADTTGVLHIDYTYSAGKLILNGLSVEQFLKM